MALRVRPVPSPAVAEEAAAAAVAAATRRCT
jgi:hypothetical protein